MNDGALQLLIVDDDEDIREVAKLLLEAEGHRVCTAADGVDAWTQLETGAPPAVILLDLMMPRMDGEQFLLSLRASDRASTPVVIMSGHSAAATKARELHADACIMKPFEVEDLIQIVRNVSRRVGNPL